MLTIFLSFIVPGRPYHLTKIASRLLRSKARSYRRYTRLMSAVPHILVQKLHPAAQLPRYAHSGPWGDLAADLYAVSESSLAPGQTAAIPTGLALGFPADFGGLIEDRSGLALRGLTTLAGVIDPGYRGEIKVVLTNLAATPHTILLGDRIAQLRLVQRLQATFEVVPSLDETVRSSSGFGSTGA